MVGGKEAVDVVLINDGDDVGDEQRAMGILVK